MYDQILNWSYSYVCREFIQQDVSQFAKQNPGTVVYLKPRRHRSPVLVAEYLNGESHWQSLQNLTVAEVITTCLVRHCCSEGVCTSEVLTFLQYYGLRRSYDFCHSTTLTVGSDNRVQSS